MWMKMIRQIGDSGVSRTALLDLRSGKMTGANTTLYIDESLLGDISFVQEGSFVETGGNPALKVVGEVQTVVGAQRVVVEQDRNKAINADEIIKSFITQEAVNNPVTREITIHLVSVKQAFHTRRTIEHQSDCRDS